MIWESEILTSWCGIVNEGQVTYVPFASHRYRIPNWQDATGAAHTPPDPNLVVIRALTDIPPSKIIESGDRFNCVLWEDREGDTVNRREFCERKHAEAMERVINEMAGQPIGPDIVGGDTSDMALTVVAWRLKMWIRTLPLGR